MCDDQLLLPALSHTLYTVVMHLLKFLLTSCPTKQKVTILLYLNNLKQKLAHAAVKSSKPKSSKWFTEFNTTQTDLKIHVSIH